jgi:hypothetical protein
MIEYYKNLSLESLFYINKDGLVCQEEWRDISGYEGIYKISNLGRRKNKSGKIQKSRIKRKYNTARLCNKRIYKEMSVHRLVAITFIPNPLSLPEVNHKNGIKSDNTVENLEWSTRSDNVKHAIKTGLMTVKKGDDCTWSKLKEDYILEIKRLNSEEKLSHSEIAKLYNVSRVCITKVINGDNWKYL